MAAENALQCRFCNTPLDRVFADLGMSPLSNSYVSADRQLEMEAFYPLCAYVCGECFLVQLPEFERAENIFDEEYAYFTSYSDTALAHARAYVSDITERLGLDSSSHVVEIASNDGYLLQYFVERGIPVLGVEPAANCAEAALKKNVRSIVDFFGVETAKRLRDEHGPADLLLGNNVLAHVPDLNDFIGGLKIALAPGGTVTMEFPHLARLMERNQFDTIYHEHFSYLSIHTVQRMFAHHGLEVFDVEELATHGGSVRIYARHSESSESARRESGLAAVLDLERERGLDQLATYDRIAEQVRETKRRLLDFLVDAKRSGKSIAAYGAPAKGNTLLNYCGIGRDFVDFTVDRSPHKQGKLLPGTRIPIDAPDRIAQAEPDYVLILPWNIQEEIVATMPDVRSWGGRWVVPIPEVRVLD